LTKSSWFYKIVDCIILCAIVCCHFIPFAMIFLRYQLDFKFS